MFLPPPTWAAVGDGLSIVLAWPLMLLGAFSAVLLGYLALLLLHKVYFELLPIRASGRWSEADPVRLRRTLERVVATPAPLGPHHKLVVRYQLACLDLTAGRHAEAVVHLRANLDCLARYHHLARFDALEADVRRRLADSLEALGRPDEAAAERERAIASIRVAPDDALRHLTRGTLLERSNRHAEAYEAFEAALAATPEGRRAERIQCMIHLLLAAFNAGRRADCLRWAEGAIAAGAEGRHLRSAHRMAGVAAGGLGRLDDAEAHHRRSHDLALAAGDQKGAGESLAVLAEVLMKRGDFVEAYAAAVRAEASSPEAARHGLLAQAEILRDWGRFDEARAALRRSDATPGAVIPHFDRRLRAVRAIAMARTEAGAGRGEAALAPLEAAEAEFRTDPKLSVMCQTTAARVAALRGRLDESAELAAQVEARLGEFERDPPTQRCALYDLALAAATRGEHRAGIDYWDRYLALAPDPYNLPTARCRRGECRLALGDRAGARDDFRAAVAANIDSHHARLAAQRLREMGPA